jgi:hypothetical protein
MEEWQSSARRRNHLLTHGYFYGTAITAMGAGFLVWGIGSDPEAESVEMGTTLEEQQDSKEFRTTFGAVMLPLGLAGLAITGIYHYLHGSPPEPTSSADNSSSRWSAGPTALGDGFQLGWSSTW